MRDECTSNESSRQPFATMLFSQKALENLIFATSITASLCATAPAVAEPQLPGTTNAQHSDLKALGIKVAVPGYIPRGFHVAKVTTQCPARVKGNCRPGPSYAIIFGSPAGTCFAIEGVAGGIGDVNLEQTVPVTSKLFVPTKKVGLLNSRWPERSDPKIDGLFTDWLALSAHSAPVYRFYSSKGEPAFCTSRIPLDEEVKIVESLKWLF